MARSETWLAGWRPYALLAALCLCLYVPGIATIPVLDRDEARFAQASRQMLETGDFVQIRFHDEARNRKPAGIYWLQAGAVLLATALEPIAEAHIAKTDAVLLAAIVAGQGALGLAYVRARAGAALG